MRSSPSSATRVAPALASLIAWIAPLIVWIAWIAWIACALAVTACRSSGPGTPDPRGAQAQGQSQPGASAPARAEPSQAQPPPDPDRADKLRDLDDLCESVDHDYADGTLGDYYSGLKLRTEWGSAQRQTGLESTQPGRLLERAAKALGTNAHTAELEHCRKLFDYLDDVE